MTWREFQLRLAGYKRIENKKWYHTREICYNIHLSIPLKKHLTRDQFMNLGDTSPRKKVSERGKELYMKAVKDAMNERREHISD